MWPLMYRSLVSPPIHRLHLEICAVAPTPAATRLVKRILEVFQAFRCILPLGYPLTTRFNGVGGPADGVLNLSLHARMARSMPLTKAKVKSSPCRYPLGDICSG